MADIKFLVMDVDGTLTDGKIYMGHSGELAKAFDIKDGCGILLELPAYGIVPVIITARESDILANRCAELGINELHQGVKDKLKKLGEISAGYGVGFDQMAYAGDDLPDIPCMREIKKAGGLVLCPSDAIPEIKAMADFVSGLKAGEGAVRDMIRFLGAKARTAGISERIEETVSWILSTDLSDIAPGSYRRENGDVYSIQEYLTKPEEDCVLESHRDHIDVQYMLEGCERFDMYSPSLLTSKGIYDSQKDVELWQGGLLTTRSILVPGSMIVVLNGQPHKGAISCGGQRRVRKLVCKINTGRAEDGMK